MNFRAGINENGIIRQDSGFFDSANIYKAKCILWKKILTNQLIPKRVGINAKLNNLNEIFYLFSKCDADNAKVPDFIIRCPTDVPCIPAVAYFRLPTKVYACKHYLKPFLLSSLLTMNTFLSFHQLQL